MGNALLAVLYQLEVSQWWPEQRLEAQQYAQLHALLQHAVSAVPYYAGPAYRRLAQGRVPTPDDWRALPILTRADVQGAGERLFARELPPGHGQGDEIYTSGSTGRPVHVRRSALWGVIWSAVTLRDHLWHRRDFSGKLAGLRESGKGRAPYPRGERAATWGRASGTLFATGPYVGLNVLTPLEQQAEWLLREDPDYILTHPSIVARLARHLQASGQRPDRLRQVLTLSEAVPADLRELCRAVFGVPLVDLYSSREAGYLALQCPDHEHYHVQSESILLEVLDEAGRACRPGEIGRVVVTPLHNFAMPLLRYDLGDYAEVGPPCACGRGLPVLTRIVGRRQNMLRAPDGRERWTLLSSSDIERLTAAAPIRRYQIAQTARDALELRVEAARPLEEDERRRLAGWLAEKFGPDYRGRVVESRSLEPNAAGKFEDVVCELPDPA